MQAFWEARKSPDHQYGPDHWYVVEPTDDAEDTILVCEINTTTRHPLKPPADKEATAKLIAAAPRLLMVCEAMLMWTDYNHDANTPLDLRDAIKAAIAKATT
jgi:hypothetical protein